MIKTNWREGRFFLVVILAAALLLTGCFMMPQVSAVDSEERDAVLAYAEPVADNLFASLGSSDYAAFSRDFDDAMKKAMKESDFNDMANFFNTNLGQYQSRVVEKVEMVDNLYVITYTAQFTDEENVSVRLSLRGDDPPEVAGLWFDSPKLRQ